jgi:gas vesicle protein
MTLIVSSEFCCALHTQLKTLFIVTVEDKKVKTLDTILKAKSKVKNELSELKERLQLAKETIHKFRDEVQNLQLGHPPSAQN